MSYRRRIRWLDAAAMAVVLWIVFAAWQAGTGDAARDPVEVLRGAFDRASAQCYDDFRGVELQACLAGVMEAHLQALGMTAPDSGALPPQPRLAGSL